MKKMLASLAVLTMTGSVVSPILATIHQASPKQDNQNNNDTNDYKPYQSQADWETYMSKNTNFLNGIKKLNNISDDYTYKKSTLAFSTIKVGNTNQPIGTLLMNGKIQTTVGSPSMASQHIIDNSQGSNPLTVNYDSKTVTNTSTVSASFTEGFSISSTISEDVGIPFDNASISTTMSFNMSFSFSATSSVQQTITFDKFSATVKPGDKEEVDYVVMQNRQVFNMVLKAKLDLSNCRFDFVNSSQDVKSISWSNLANNKVYNQLFAKEVSNSIDAAGMKKHLQSLMDFDRLNDPTLPVEKQNYDANTAYIYLPLSFTVDGYSTLITQTKL